MSGFQKVSGSHWLRCLFSSAIIEKRRHSSGDLTGLRCSFVVTVLGCLLAIQVSTATAQDRQTRIQTLLSQNDKLRYEGGSNKFFMLNTNRVNWTTAEADARDPAKNALDGHAGRLAIIGSQAENATVHDLIRPHGDIWLAGSDQHQEGDWRWYVDGAAGEKFFDSQTWAIEGVYHNFRPGEPNDLGDEDAVVIYHGSGEWNDLNVNNQHFYLVEWDADLIVGPATAEEAAIDAVLAENPGVRYLGSTNKFYAARSERVNWSTALANAQSAENALNGITGQLAVIRSQEENDVVRQLADTINVDVYVGGSDRVTEKDWQWYSNGEPADSFFDDATEQAIAGAYTNFASGEPNDLFGEDGLTVKQNGEWNDSDHNFGYVIEYDATAVVDGVLLADAPKALDSIPVPEPSNLSKYIKSKEKAIALGKALFWDMQVGSDGRTACATCHFGAGIDLRTVNVVNPGAPGSAFGPQRQGQQALLDAAIAAFEGPNEAFDAAEFPHTKTAHPTNSIKSDNQVVEDTAEVYGSAGVVRKDFVRIVENNPVDEGNLVFDPVFNIAGANARQVTERNSPTTINAVFFDRLFWDGRANNVFNGVNEFGRTDGSARVYKLNADGTMKRVRIALENAALASQAVGPPLSDVEMSWHARNFKELGRKMLSLKPLGLQQVDSQDSVLGRYATSRRGLRIKYSSLIKQSFKKNWWGSTEFTDDGYTHMEANFSLYFGLALQMYQATLVSDQAPYDAWANGDESALTDAQKRGLKIFLNEGKCINCHGGAEFAGATVSDIRSMQPNHVTGEESLSLVEFMDMQQGPTAFYDGGFYNIGVRPTLEDLGVGARGPFGPLSYTRQRRDENRDIGQDVTINSGDRVAVDGAFKTPTLRNIELTGPYFHNGGVRTLRETVQFYVRGANFFHENIDDLDPDVDGISELQDDPSKIGDVVQFLKSLTDERVRFQRAPFDHPELRVPNGHKDEAENGVLVDRLMTIPAVGKNGGEEILSFEERVQ